MTGFTDPASPALQTGATGVESPATARAVGTSRRTLGLTLRSGAVGAVATGLSTLLLTPYILRTIGSTGFAVWAVISSIIAIAGLADAGIRTEMMRRVGAAYGRGDLAALRSAVHEAVSLLTILAAALVAVGVVAAPYVRSAVFPYVHGADVGEIDALIRCTVVLVGVSLVVGGYLSALRGLQRSDVELLGRFLAVVISASLTVIAIHAGLGLWSLFIAAAAQIVTVWVLQWWALRSLVPSLRFRVRFPIAGFGYVALSGLILLSQVSDVVDFQWDKLVLSRLVGTQAVTAYVTGTMFVLQARTLALLPLMPLLVAIAELGTKQRNRAAQLYDLLARSSLIAGAAILSAFVVFAPALVRAWIGPDYPGAVLVMRLFAIAMFVNMLAAPWNSIAVGNGRHRMAASSAVVNMTVNGVASILLTLRFGLLGSLLGSILGNGCGVLAFVVLLRRAGRWEWCVAPMRAIVVVGAGTALAVLLDLPRFAASWPGLIILGGAWIAVTAAVSVLVEPGFTATLLAAVRRRGVKPWSTSGPTEESTMATSLSTDHAN